MTALATIANLIGVLAVVALTLALVLIPVYVFTTPTDYERRNR